MERSSKTSISLRLKLTALVLLVAVLPLGVVGYVLIDVKTEAIRDANRKLLFAVIRDIAKSIENTFAETEDRLTAFGRVLAKAEIDPDVRVLAASEVLSGARSIERAAVYDAGGALVAVVAENDAPGRFSMPETLAAPLRDAAAAEGRAVDQPAVVDGRPRVLLVVPIDGQGATWFAATYASLEPVQKRLEAIARDRFNDDLSSLIVIDNRFHALAHPNRELSDTLTPMNNHGLLRGFGTGRLPQRVTLFKLGVDDGDEKVVGALVSIDHLGWGILAQRPTDIAFASVTEMRRLVLGVLAVVIALAIGAAFFLAHRLTSPIRALVGFARDLANRRFDSRVTIHTRDELSVLGNALTMAASDLAESERQIEEEVAIRSNLGRYLPSQLVDRVVSREQNLELGGERREITVLFADVAGFTPLAESHAADEVVTILNELFTILTEIVFRHHGTVDKFIGDCVMAFWGAPDDQPDHAALALRAAEDMLRFLEVGNQSWEEKYGVNIRLAIGVHTGDAVVGNFGSETRMEYTAIGDVVNVAAHLESMARPQQIIATKATRGAAGDSFTFLELGPQKVAGRRGELELFEVRV